MLLGFAATAPIANAPVAATPLPTPAGAPPAFSLDTDSLTASVDEWYLRTEDGCRLLVRELGVGDTLVVLHGGWGAEHEYLGDLFAGLLDRYHLVFYDQRGSLRSPCPDSLISVDAHVEDLETLRRELSIPRLTLVGHSMGTFLAMSYLEVHPDHTGRMVLLGPIIPRIELGDDDSALHRSQEEAFRAWAESQAEKEIREEGLDRPDSTLDSRERTHKWRISFASANIFRVDRWRWLKGGQVFYSQAAGSAAGRSMGTWDFTDDLDRHPYPVTMILGDHDLVGFGGELHRRLVSGLDGTELVLIRDAGHNAWIDRPERVREALLRGLERR